MPRMITGVSSLIPRSIVEEAARLAIAEGAEPFTETHLVVAALIDTDETSSLPDAVLDTRALRAALAPHLAESNHGLPSVEVFTEQGKSGVRRRPTPEHLEGRAVVLARVEEPHGLDGLDIFVAALFDPQSMTTRAVVEDLSLDRDELIDDIKKATSRYQGVAFPATRIITTEQ